MALVDVFVLSVLAGVATAFWIRKVVRPARFDGSHLGEADFILAMIALVVLTLLGWHASRIAAGLNEWPAHASFLSNWISGAIPAPRVAERVLRLGARGGDPRPSSPTCRTRSICTSRRRRSTSSSRARGRRGRLEPLRFDVPDDEMRFGVGNGRRPDVEGDGRLVLVHRVRALPGRLPRVRDREAPLAEAR